jgi:glycosyltransferase involved in cell wall biosynthesis
MRILLVGKYPLDHQHSMRRYAAMLQLELARMGHEVKLIAPEVKLGGLKRDGMVGKWLGYADKYLLFPRVLRREARGFDLVHVCDHSNSMYLKETGRTPASITCHDLLAIFSATGRYPGINISATGRLQQRWISKNLASARRVVCVSAHTAEQLRELVGLQGGNEQVDQRIAMIHNPLGQDYAPAGADAVERLRAEMGLASGETYLLHVGGDGWYKNRTGAVRIYAQLVRAVEARGDRPPRLVLAGDRFSGELQRKIVELGLERQVISRPAPTDEELGVLYSGAQALLFVSLQEGFGWPILEAQSCGCPVIASNRAPMTEVAGEAALLIDPENEAAAAEAISARLDSLAELRAAGFENLKRFDRGEIMKRYEEFFLEASGTQPPPVTGSPD